MNCHSMGKQMGRGGCSCHGGMNFMSKEKKIAALKEHIAHLNEKKEDIEAYIKELEQG